MHWALSSAELVLPAFYQFLLPVPARSLGRFMNLARLTDVVKVLKSYSFYYKKMIYYRADWLLAGVGVGVIAFCPVMIDGNGLRSSFGSRGAPDPGGSGFCVPCGVIAPRGSGEPRKDPRVEGSDFSVVSEAASDASGNLLGMMSLCSRGGRDSIARTISWKISAPVQELSTKVDTSS